MQEEKCQHKTIDKKLLYFHRYYWRSQTDEFLTADEPF